MTFQADLITSTLSPGDNNNPPITKIEHNDFTKVNHPSTACHDNHVYLAENMDGYSHGSTEVNETENNMSNEQLLREALEMDNMYQREQ